MRWTVPRESSRNRPRKHAITLQRHASATVRSSLERIATFIGSLALWREGALYRVEAIDHLLGRRARQALAVVTHLAMLALAAIFAVMGRDFMLAAGETTPFLQIDKVYWYAAIPVCGALMCVYSVAALWRALKGDIQSREEIVTLG